jgi:hypothetical protein
MVDHQGADHQQQQRQDHRPAACTVRAIRGAAQDPRRCLAERQQRQQQERQIDQQIGRHRMHHRRCSG